MLKWDLNYLVETPEESNKKDFARADYTKMRQSLSNINWATRLHDCNTEEAWSQTKKIVNSLIDQHVPMKKPKKKKAVWLTRKALKAVRRKHKAWRKYQKRKTIESKQHYKKCQTEAKQETRIAKRDFEKKLAENIKTDPKSFYAYVRSKQKVKDAVGPLKNDDGETLQSGQETADALNRFFASVFTNEDTEVPDPTKMYKGPEDGKLLRIQIDQETVKKKLEKLDPCKAAGPDGIPPSILKNLADELSTPITLIFNKSLKEGTVPEDWRTAHIIPIFKKGSRSKPGNYRPISLT